MEISAAFSVHREPTLLTSEIVKSSPKVIYFPVPIYEERVLAQLSLSLNLSNHLFSCGYLANISANPKVLIKVP